jgi:hypothetical protein
VTPEEQELTLAQTENLTKPDVIELAMILAVADAWVTAPDSGYRLQHRRHPSTVAGMRTLAKQALVEMQRDD